MRDVEGDPEEQGSDAPPEDAGGHHTPVTQQLGRIAVVLIAIVFVVFAAANAQHVDFSWVVGETEVVAQGGERVEGGVRLIVLLLVAFAAGAFVAGILAWQRARPRRD
jgi:hypothetical protein